MDVRPKTRRLVWLFAAVAVVGLLIAVAVSANSGPRNPIIPCTIEERGGELVVIETLESACDDYRDRVYGD